MFEKERIYGRESLVKVASIQMEVEFGEVDNNVEKGIERINEAADNGANMIVLPELFNTGLTFNSRKEAYELAEVIPEGKTTKELLSIAKERELYIVAGISEKDGVNLYNSSILVGPDGFIGKYRKLHLWGDDKLVFEPGDLNIPVYNTPIGRIAMLICYDMWFHETWRICAAKGADIVCCPVNWLVIETLPEDMPSFGPYNTMCAAYNNSLFIVAANKVGYERGVTFTGQSMIVGLDGMPIGGEASRTDEQIIYAECNIVDARKLHWGDYNAARIDRRVDIYEAMLGAEGKILPW